MKLTRFSIAGLMGLVLVIAVGLVGLKEANPVWASAFFTVTLIALVLAILNAVQDRGRTRAFWTGFAVSGWIYFLCAFGLGSESGTAGPPLLTEFLINKTEPLFHPKTSTSVPPPVPVLPATPPASVSPFESPSVPANFSFYQFNLPHEEPYQSYRQVGHSLAALLAGYLGGLYSLFIAARRDRRQAEPAPTVSPSSP